MTYKTGHTKRDRIFDFEKFETTRSVGSDLWKGNITLEDVAEDHEILVDATNNFYGPTRPKKMKQTGRKITQKP